MDFHTMHPDIGKRVMVGGRLTGTLLAAHKERERFIIQLDAPNGGVVPRAGTPGFDDYVGIHKPLDKNCCFASSYTLIPTTMKTLETLEVGDLVSDDSTAYPLRRVLAVLGGVGKTRLYAMSDFGTNAESDDLNDFDTIWTANQLKNDDYTVYVPKVTEVTLDQVAQKMGVPVSQLRIKE